MDLAIRTNYAALRSNGASYTWTLNNHDAQRVVTRFGRADAHEFYSGNNLVNSTAPVDLALGTRRARAALLMMLALPGCTYLYMGEELGLPEVLDLPDDRREDPIFLRSRGSQLGRDGCRVPIPWNESAQNSYGFSLHDVPAWLPQPDDWGGRSVERQLHDPDSMLSLYRRALAARPLFVAEGDDLLIERDDDALILRRGRAVSVVNFGSAAITIANLDIEAGLRRVVVSHPDDVTETGLLAGNSAAWLYPI